MARRFTRQIPRFVVSLLFTLGFLVGGMATSAQAARAAGQAPNALNAAAQALTTGSMASRPQWGPLPNSRGSGYICCYTGKGEDVLLIHGVDGSYEGANGNDPNGNCHVNFGNLVNILDNTYQWVGNLINLEYYSGESGHCTFTSSDPPNFEAANMRTSAHAYKCDNYFDGYDGTNDEDDLHLACLLAWYIWDNYTVNTWTVNVVAHSLGGVLVKEALFQIEITKDTTHFPPYLYLDHVVTLDSPLAGIPLGGLISCGGCFEVAEMQWPVGEIYGDLTNSNGKGVQGLGGTTWIMEGEANTQCDHVGDSAFGMSYGTKVDYRFAVPGISSLADACSPNNDGNYYYGHGTFLQDTQTTDNVEVAYCGNCSSDPPISTPVYNFHHSLVEVYWGLAGNCAASPSVNHCDGDDPNVTSCANSKTLPGGDPWYLNVYWTNSCSTNWALVYAPVSGSYLVKVTLARSPTKSWSNVDRHLIYCAPSRTTCPNDTWFTFGQYTTAWITDMVYAPNEAVAVQIVTTTGTYTSIWH